MRLRLYDAIMQQICPCRSDLDLKANCVIFCMECSRLHTPYTNWRSIAHREQKKIKGFFLRTQLQRQQSCCRTPHTKLSIAADTHRIFLRFHAISMRLGRPGRGENTATLVFPFLLVRVVSNEEDTKQGNRRMWLACKRG